MSRRVKGALIAACLVLPVLYVAAGLPMLPESIAALAEVTPSPSKAQVPGGVNYLNRVILPAIRIVQANLARAGVPAASQGPPVYWEPPDTAPSGARPDRPRDGPTVSHPMLQNPLARRSREKVAATASRVSDVPVITIVENRAGQHSVATRLATLPGSPGPSPVPGAPVNIDASSLQLPRRQNLAELASLALPNTTAQAGTVQRAPVAPDQTHAPLAPAPQAQAPPPNLMAAALGMDTPDQPIIAPPGLHQVAPRYTGKLISLDLRSVDIRDFFRLIHRISGLNIVVDSDITGKVTLVLDDVPWDQALDLVLKNNGLGRVLEGNVLRIARIQTLEAEADQSQQLQDARLKGEPLITIVHRLHYASAEDQQPMTASSGMSGMSGMGGAGMGSSQQKPIPGVTTILKSTNGVLSPRGSVVSDPRDNAIIVTDVPSQIPIINSFIDKLDTKSKQLSIKVRVVLASNAFTRGLSSVLSASYRNKSGSTQAGSGTGSNTAGTFSNGMPVVGASPTSTQTLQSNSGSSSSSTTSQTFGTGVSPVKTGSVSTGQTISSVLNQAASVSQALTAPGFGAFAITNAGARYLINEALSAAEEHDQARTISRPTIVTQNNFPGTVMQGVQIPIQTSINLTVAVQYVNAALVLMVTPHITGDHKIFLDINVDNGSPGTISVQGVGISINTQAATTRVLVPDGGTVVFGGITVTTRARSATYVPLLGSIPVVGNLFKSSNVNDQNQELLFFVSPKILPD